MEQSRKPAFLITLDTEGDNLWHHGRPITTENARFLPRFQRLCEKYRLRPTYLTNWEMATSEVFQEFASDALARGTAEIGMHLHAWNSPPIVPLTDDDNQHHPYLIEFPEHVLREKVAVMTDVLENTFQTKMLSHRAGRWAFNEVYARALVDHGYKVDCTVTPHLSWKQYLGNPNGAGGSDYRDFPDQAYFVDLTDIRHPGASTLLEVPVTVAPPFVRAATALGLKLLSNTCRFGARVARRICPAYVRLTPNGRNLRLLLAVLEGARRERRDYVEFMIHTSELMPGGSPRFPTPASIESLYGDLESLFSAAASSFEALTLAQYACRFTGRNDHLGAGSAARGATVNVV